jgi:hypothetical protein
VKKSYEEEAKERQSLLGRYRNLKHEHDGLVTVHEEEVRDKKFPFGGIITTATL